MRWMSNSQRNDGVSPCAAIADESSFISKLYHQRPDGASLGVRHDLSLEANSTRSRPAGKTLLLTRRDVAALLDLDACIAAVEAAFRLYGERKTAAPGVLGVQVP